MSTTIDQKVVEMQFNNKHFESNVATTMSTLDKFKQSLNLTGATKGLENIDRAAKSVNLSGLTTAAETVGLKFNAMYTMADQALRSITNSAMAAGKKIVSALTIDPIKTGLQEYETQINAVQTIMANTQSKGTTIDDVNKALDELNTYADKTIYNFTEMTRNIGTFTAAGVDLDTSVKSIQGIANLAAVSGSSSQQASTAMYQLSQALAAGKVNLMDWNSVVNAGMGGQVFQDALKRTAKVMGTDVDALIKKYGSFRESLSKGEWLTSEVLTKTLEQFTMAAKEGSKEWENYKKSLMDEGYTAAQAEEILKMANTATDAATKVKTFTQLFDTLKESAQSGWSQTWEIILGDFEEAKELFSELYNTLGPIIEASAKARNELLQGWKDAGGRSDLIESLFNVFKSIGSIVKPIKEAFSEIFPPLTVQQLVNFTEGLKEFTSKLTLSDNASKNLKRTFKGLFAIIDIVKQAFGAVFTVIKPLLGGVDNLGGGILSITATCGDWLVALRNTIRETDIFGKIAEKVVNVLKILGNVFKTVKEAVRDFLSGFNDKFDNAKKSITEFGKSLKTAFLERFGDRMISLETAADVMKTGVVTAFEAITSAFSNCDFLKILGALWKGITTIGSGIAKAFGEIASVGVEKLGNADFNGFFDFLNSLIAGGVGVGIINFLRSTTKTFTGFKDILDGVVDIFDGVRGCFEAYQTQLKAGTLMKIASAIAVLVAAIVVLTFIDSAKLNTAIGAITMLFVDLIGAMAIVDNLGSNFKGLTKVSTTLIGMSIAVLILASAVKKLAGLETGELAKGIIGVVALTATMVAAVKILGSGGKTVIKGATQIVIFAAAIKILASVCSDLSSLNWEELAKGLIGVGVLVAEMIAFTKFSKSSVKMMSTAIGIVVLSAALKILASVCGDFAQMGWEDIGKGLAGVGGLLVEIMAFTNLTGNAKHVISTGVALIAIGAAMKIFVSAIQGIATMSWEEIGKGLAGMAGALLAVTAAVKLMPKNMISTGIGLIGIATAMIILTNALTAMSGMSWEGIGKSLTTLGGSILILAVGLRAMNGTLLGSAALLIAATSLTILTPVLKSLGSMNWESIGKGLIALAGAFAVIGVAGLSLGPIIPSILGLAAAFALIGVGALAIGGGLLAAAAGFTALAAALSGGATAIVAALSVIVIGVANLIPFVIAKIGEGLLLLCQVIADGAPAVGKAIKAIVLSLMDVLVECVPVIADGVLKVVTGVLSSLVEYTPQIVDLLFQFIIGVLDGLSSNIPGLIQAAVNVIMSVFVGVIEAIKSIDLGTLTMGIAGVGLMAGIMMALSAVASLIPGAMIGVLGIGAVVAEMALVLAAIGALAQIPGLNWLINEGGELLQGIGTAIGKFVGGIVGGFMGGVSAQFPQIGSDLSAFMTNVQPFINGASAINPAMMDGVKALAETILILTAANILEGLTSWFTGGSSLAGFGEDLAGLGTSLNQFAMNLGTFDESKVATITCAANAVKALAQAADSIPNEGGWAAKIFGENSIATFGSYLPQLGLDLNQFATNLGSFDDSKVTTVTCAANAIKSLAQAADAIPNEGGWAAKILGDNSIATFGSHLPQLGTDLSTFAANLGSFDESKVTTVTCAANAIKHLAQAADALPNEGGWAAKIFGDNSISTFASKLPDLGTNMASFATNLGTFDESKVATVTCAANAIKAMAKAAESIDGQADWAKKIFGDNSLSTFGTELEAVGTNLKNFANNLGTFNEAKVATVTCAVKAINALSGLANADLKGAKKNLGDFGEEVVDFASDLSDFCSNMPATDSINTATNNVKKILSMIKDISGANADSLANFAKSLKSIGKDGVKAFVEAFTSSAAKTDAKQAAINLVKQAIEGAESKKSAVEKAFKSIASAGATAARDKYQTFYNAGSHLVSGFAAGISENDYKAEAKARAMAKAAAKAAEEALDINSPSKVFRAIGSSVPEGFALGIEKIGDVTSAARHMATSTINNVKSSIARIAEIIDSDIDAQPTIRPVLDLSSVRSGAGAISRLFGTGASVDVLTNVGAISEGMNRHRQNGANGELVSEIRKLRKDFSNLDRANYTINGLTYDDGSNVSHAVKSLVRAAKIERRI